MKNKKRGFIRVFVGFFASVLIIALFLRVQTLEKNRLSEDEKPQVGEYGPFKIITTPEIKIVKNVPKNPTPTLAIVAGFAERSDFISLINRERVNFDLGTLSENVSLDNAAQKKAEDMALGGWFSHTSPTGFMFTQYIDDSGYVFSFSGENLAKDFKTPIETHAALMASPTHRANILDPNYKEIGIGIAQSSSGAWYVVEMFGTQGE